jgi:hypothetical protein
MILAQSAANFWQQAAAGGNKKPRQLAGLF